MANTNKTHHENLRWKACLIAVNSCPNGASTRHIARLISYGHKETYGFLYRMREKNLVQRKNSGWYPSPTTP